MPRSPRLLLVASTGGHLAQLYALAPRLPLADGMDRTWVTFDTPQSRSLLAGEDVRYVAYTAPRDWRTALRNLGPAFRLLSTRRFEHVVSTGSAIALTFLPLARALGLQTTYIESSARCQGPSLTGNTLARVPGIRLATQYRAWEGDRWRYAGSVLDAFAAEPRTEPIRVQRVFVTLGTIPYGFRRVVERILSIAPGHVDIRWQTGFTDVRDLPIDATESMSGEEIAEAIQRADVVIAHAGTGSAIAALAAGKCPVLVPRSASAGEHVDEHQREIAAELAQRGLAVSVQLEDLQWRDVEATTRIRIRSIDAPLLRLDGRSSP